MKCFLMALGTKTQFFSGAWTPCMLWTPHTPPHFLLGVSLRRAPTPTPTRTSAWQAGPCSSPGSHPRRDLLGGGGGGERGILRMRGSGVLPPSPGCGRGSLQTACVSGVHRLLRPEDPEAHASAQRSLQYLAH